MHVDEFPWHSEVITPEVTAVLGELGRQELLGEFYLAGGTALALYLGHRKSVDLDFFTPTPFNEDALLVALQPLHDLAMIAKAKETLHLHVGGVKVSFLGYPYPPLFPLRRFMEMRVADPRDIACMKVSALASRGTRRDFVDLYAAAQQYGLQALLELFTRKFSQVRYNMVHILKSLTYFADAEKEPMPDMLLPLSWGEITTFFEREVPRLKLI